MTKEELNKPVTLNNLMETLVTFNEEKAVPRMKEVMQEMLDNQFENKIKPEIDTIKTDVSELKNDVSELKTDVGILKTTMVTKTYLDDKIADLKGEFVTSFKKEDEKIEKITDKLGDKKIFNSEDIKEIKSIEVFAKAV